MQQISRGKFDRLQRTTARFTCTRLDGYGLRCSLPTRPRVQASYLVLVHRRTLLLHASFRPHLAMTPLRFANPSPPSGWIRDSHPQTVEHARHTKTQATPAWKTPLAFPTLPQLRRRGNFVRSTVRILGAGQHEYALCLTYPQVLADYHLGSTFLDHDPIALVL
jgi:hypothetical protein